ncbi:MAG TPA: hypothetical protein VHO92_02200 [Methanobacterium sp.]|nr:hypothetical protein [Methanobacterium sp.]
MADKEIVQIAMRAEVELKNEIKIMAIKKGITMNDLLVRYVKDGIERDKREERAGLDFYLKILLNPVFII